MKSLVVATRNSHKFGEIVSFLQSDGHSEGLIKQYLGVSVTLKSLLDFPDLPEIDEDCLSFEGNALKKAKTISLLVKQPVLADDSGLEVAALDGRPGVFSARYAGEPSNDKKNNEKLLGELEKIPAASKQAAFICSMVLYMPDGSFYTSRGELSGIMIDEYRGKNGFGYDPIFYIPDRKCTLAEILQDEKIKFSHRTRALENLLSQKINFS